MKHCLYLLFLLLTPSAFAQNIDYSTQVFFTNNESQNRYTDGVFWGEYYMHLSLRRDKIIIEKVDAKNESIKIIYEKTFTIQDVSPSNMGVVDGTFWFLDDNKVEPRPDLITVEINTSNDSFEEKIERIFYGVNNINHSQLINRNDSLILWISTFASFTQVNNLSYLELYINKTKNRIEYLTASSIDVDMVDKASHVLKSAQNDSLMLLIVDDANNQNFAYVTFDMHNRKVSYEIKPYQFENDIKNYAGFYSKGIVRKNGFVNSHRYYRAGEDYNLTLAGYNTDIDEWFYADNDLRFSKDSLSEKDESNYKSGPITQLPNGDIVASAVFYESFTETMLDGNQNIKLVVKVFSNDDVPFTKAVYIYDNPMNFSPATVQYINEGELLFSGYITNYSDRDSIYSNPAYFKVGDNKSLGIKQKIRNENIKFSISQENNTLNLLDKNITKVEIFDEMGRLLLHESNPKQNIDISKLSKGLLVLRVQKNGSKTYQFANFIK